MNNARLTIEDMSVARAEGLYPTAAAERFGVSRSSVLRAERRTGATLPRAQRDDRPYGNDHREVAMSLPPREAVEYLLEVIAGLQANVSHDWILPGAHLTRSERQILRCVVDATPRIATKAMLLDALMSGREGDDAPAIKIVDVFICRIRQKIAPLSILIETHWGIGYTASAPEGFVWPWMAAE